MENTKNLILIDGHALAFRQYFALERTNMRTSDGQPTWAVYGFFKAIFDVLKNKNLQPDAICVAFDVSHRTFRVEKYEDYKANREAMPDNMRTQMNLIYEGLKAFNIPVYSKEGYEADDVIGTISKKACELGHKIYILTGDRDAFQLVDKEGCVKVILPSKGVLAEFDWDKVYEKMSVYPNQVIDYKALCGDSSDNIPGVRGIGEKTAVKLLTEYGSFQNLIKCLPQMKECKVKQLLTENLETAELSYFLATIVRDVDIDFDFEQTKIVLPDAAKVTPFLKKLQFYSFLKNIDIIISAFNKNATKPGGGFDMLMPQAGQVQLGLFSDAVKAEINKKEIKLQSKIITDIKDLYDLTETLKTKSIISFRVEGYFKDVCDNFLGGIALAYNDNFTADERVHYADNNHTTHTFYIPVGHYSDNQLKKQDVVNALKPIFEDENIKKVAHDIKGEYNFLRALSIECKGLIFDTMLASYVCDTKRNHNLDIQAFENIEHVLNDYIPLERNSITNMSIVDISVENANTFLSDVLATVFELTAYWINKLDEKETDILYNIEVPVAIVLADMECDGVAIDVEYLDELSKSMSDSLRTIEFQIYNIAGEAFNIVSPKQVSSILYEKLKIKYPRKIGKAGFSTGAEILEELAQEHEIAKLILAYRKFAKLKSTYTDTLPELINPKDHKIHSTYNQTITATGRLSSSYPNLQNIPVRTEDGNKIRKAFVPSDRENALIMSADYSQIELRLLAHVSGDENLIAAFKSGVDVHTLTASKIFNVPTEEVTKQMRYKAKAVNFGIVYGQSKFGLSRALGISMEDADSFITRYFETYPKVKTYTEDMVNFVAENGYVQTIFGRKRYLFTEFNSTSSNIREFAKRAAINQPMQGSAADLIKIAMIDLKKQLISMNLKSKLIIQVHDELVLEAYKDEVEILKQIVTQAMELNQPLKVPLLVGIRIGSTWQELM